MLHKEISKEEIDKFVLGKGDFVQIDHLSELLKENLSLDIKKYVALKLVDIYERRSMLTDAAKMFDLIALNSIAFTEKMKNYVRSAGMFIRAGEFERAEETVRKAQSYANASEKNEINFIIKDFYKRQAEIYEKEIRRASAVKIYERLLEMNLNEEERKEVKEKLLDLYERLGRMREYFDLKKGVFHI